MNIREHRHRKVSSQARTVLREPAFARNKLRIDQEVLKRICSLSGCQTSGVLSVASDAPHLSDDALGFDVCHVEE